MPVLTDDDSDEKHGEAPEEHHHWVAEHTLSHSFIFHSPHFLGMTVVTRSDAFWEVSFSVGDLLCCPDRIVIKRDLCCPIPVA
jgi:hypothetical protein